MSTTPTTPLNETVLRNARPEIAVWLTAFVERHGGFVGSVHLAGLAEEGEIVLVAAHNLPPAVQNGTSVIPVGKGMAGVAAQRRAPVAITDFRNDTSGVAVPQGRAAGAKGSLTLPVSAPDDDTRPLAVVGLGFEDVREFTGEEIETYRKDAATVLEVHAV
ncbi:GAF domain-containing protein [Streptomyces spongiae]|uniref:GAF domain-containing protein n=1 Tax=Streptomyces spongiae TaxID=565072 RepID=A0A5N8XMN0_9ACTN|nr:GAF domain-containing protein [Streptomyces spongiae]MPY60689.1 GAF domain-containing protein [Streptomyces spongiae]